MEKSFGGGEGVERIDVEVDIGSGIVCGGKDADADANARRKVGRALAVGWRDVRMADGMPKLDVCRPRPGGGDLDGDSKGKQEWKNGQPRPIVSIQRKVRSGSNKVARSSPGIAKCRRREVVRVRGRGRGGGGGGGGGGRREEVVVLVGVWKLEKEKVNGMETLTGKRAGLDGKGELDGDVMNRFLPLAVKR